MLFSEPKIPQSKFWRVSVVRDDVSVLFSEPKIPQLELAAREAVAEIVRFSALQRAENSSIHDVARICRGCRGFSALQRAENSSIDAVL